MNELKAIFENKLVVAVVVILVVVLGVVFGMNTLVDKTSDRVIEKLQRDYAPGPYVPGCDPDKINPNFWRNQQQPYIDQRPQSVGHNEKWQNDWERQRLR
jgi:hypothetical protein